MFSTFFLERAPLTLNDVLTDGLLAYLRIVGAVVAVVLLIWWIVQLVKKSSLLTQKTPLERSVIKRHWGQLGFTYCSLAAFVGYLALGVYWLPELFDYLGSEGEPSFDADKVDFTMLGLAIAGGLALLAVLLPFIHNLAQMSWRRIWGIARLSFKEAVRRRIVYVFLALLPVILFATWFVPYKAEDQIRNYVSIVDKAIKPLLFLPAALLAAFSIPTDIKKQAIHTIVTKPVEKFEIIFGRFLGFTLLMTLILFVMATGSLFFVLRGTNPEARAESLTAREPLYGTIRYEDLIDGIPQPGKATNVGREWGYRGYIEGGKPNATTQHYAVWDFTELPELGNRQTIRCETTFDIYRTEKGDEKKPILGSFFLKTWRFKDEDREKFRQELLGANPEEESKLAEKFGYYEIEGVSIADFHTTALEIPVGLFRNAMALDSEEAKQQLAVHQGPLLTVSVRCDSPRQFLGMAQYDFWLREDNPETSAGTLPFVMNFYKATTGVWFRLMLFVGLCVTLSTQLGGFIAFLGTTLLYFGGVFREFISSISSGNNIGGGVMESTVRLFARTKAGGQLEESTATDIVMAIDDVYRAVLQPFISILPDVERYDFTKHVANGFNIGLFSQDLFPAFLMLVTYLLPWFLLGFYLLKSREIAGAH